MNLLLVLFTAMAISVVVIPIMLRFAPALGLIDRPDPRKVHSVPVARVGGWGVVVGAVIPLALWLPLDRLMLCYLWGTGVLFVWGTVDDRFNIGHFRKFAGQFIAVAPVVYLGDLYVERFPFGLAFDPDLAKMFTMVAMVGVINAINHADGLDGLAGGQSLLSLISIAVLTMLGMDGFVRGSFAFDGGVLYEGMGVLVIAAAVSGGVLGFLRYNSHPARVFMGDTGSQFLGFTLGFITVLLTQRVNPALSPALPLLFIGLPIFDILGVLFLRASGGMNWFRGTRNHIHHRLLDLGFEHPKSVVAIYSVQAALTASAVFLCYEHDGLIVALYLAVVLAVFGSLTVLERAGWRTGDPSAAPAAGAVSTSVLGGRVVMLAGVFVSVMVPVYLVGSSASLASVPQDITLAALVLVVLLLVDQLTHRGRGSPVTRLIVYVTGIFVTYLVFFGARPERFALGVLDDAFFWLLALALAVCIRRATRQEFQMSPMDYLMLIFVLTLGVNVWLNPEIDTLGALPIKIIVVLYACEFLLNKSNRSSFALVLACFVALGALSVRGLMDSPPESFFAMLDAF